MVFATLLPGQAAAQAIGCTLTLEQPGELGTSVDGLTLGSEEDGGREARLRIESTFERTITIAPPTMTQSPADFDDAGQRLETAYTGNDGFAAVSQSYTQATTNFQVDALSNDTIDLQARSVTANGVVEGTYQLRVVVTCS